jgi:hypothetical protein
MKNYVSYIKFNKHTALGDVLDSIAMILIVCWAIGYFAYSAGGNIHILLVIALIAVLIRLIQSKSSI